MDIFTESGERGALALEARRVLNGNYEIGRVLGKGGFGITYAALDRSLQMPVAIKEYLPTSVAGRGTDRATVEPHGGKDADVFESGLNAFLKEGQTLAKFNHPNIVRVLAFFRENGTGYLVMPFLEGRTLAHHITDAGGKISPQEAARIILPVLDGLRSVHGEGFLHRDIKPQNIYLTDGGGVILIDFGAARITFGQESQSLSAVLTPGYAPFEQYYRKGNQGAWTDVYAAAATFYRAITGIRPAESPERNETDGLQPANLVEPSISQSLSDALTRALAPKPEDRTQSVDALHAELVSALGGEAPAQETMLAHTMAAATIPAVTTPAAASSIGAETVLDGRADTPLRAEAQAPSSPDRDSGGGSTTPTARLTLTAKRPCQILIDGEEVARLAKGEARTFMLIPGVHTVSAKGSGGVTNETSLDLRAGEERRVTIRLDGASTRAAAGRSAGVPKGLLIGGAVALVLVIIAVAFWPDGENANVPATVVASNQQNLATPISPPEILPPASPEGQVLTIPYSGGGTLGPGDNTLQSGEYMDAYRFYGYAGQYVAASLSSEDFDTYLIIFTPSGERIDVDDYEDDTSLTVVADTLPLEGWYEIIVTSFSVGETGSYLLELSL